MFNLQDAFGQINLLQGRGSQSNWLVLWASKLFCNLQEEKKKSIIVKPDKIEQNNREHNIN